MISLKQLYITLFIIGWFFFPFNDFEGIPALGEFKSEAGSFFFMGGFIVLLIYAMKTGKISIPYKSPIFKILGLFLLWCIITVALNFDTVNTNYFKHTGGVYRFIRQYISILISCLIFVIFYWNVIINWTAAEILYKIRKVFLISLIFVFCYGFVETLIVVFHLNAFKYILAIADYFPFLDDNYQDNRISSVAYEAPSLGNFLITVSGWMLSYIFTEKSKYRFIPLLMILFLMFFSGSRTAMINITLQFMILFTVMFSMPQYRRAVINVIKYSIVIISVTLIVNGNKVVRAVNEKVESLNFSKNLKNNISNQSRFGMQYASLEVFKENPIVGVGFGQETYHKRFHYPGWAKKNNWEFKGIYQNNSITSFPTAYNLYTRLLAETGIIGIVIFISLIYMCFSKSIYLFRNSNSEEKTLAFILIISFTGLSLNWFQTDFFRQHGFWLCMVILIRLLLLRKNKSAILQPTN